MWLFGDGKSAVNSSTLPHSTLGKRWNALSHHRVREAVAANIVRFEFAPSEQNSADCLTKSLPCSVAKDHLMPRLFWKGETDPTGMQVSAGSDTQTDTSNPGSTGEGVTGKPKSPEERPSGVSKKIPDGERPGD